MSSPVVFYCRDWSRLRSGPRWAARTAGPGCGGPDVFRKKDGRQAGDSAAWHRDCDSGFGWYRDFALP